MYQNHNCEISFWMYAACQIFTFLWTSVEVLPPPLSISLFKLCRKIAAEGIICCVLTIAALSLSKASVAITSCLMTNGKNAHALLGRSLFYDVYINGSEVSAGLIRLRSTPLPKLQGLEYVLNVTATDDNASGGPHSLTSTARVVVGVDDVNNNKPIFEQVRIFAKNNTCVWQCLSCSNVAGNLFQKLHWNITLCSTMWQHWIKVMSSLIYQHNSEDLMLCSFCKHKRLIQHYCYCEALLCTLQAKHLEARSNVLKKEG